MLVFFIIISSIIVINLIIILSTLKINILDININNINEQKKIHYEIQLKIQLYFLNKIKIASIYLDSKKLKKYNILNKMKQVDIKQIEKIAVDYKEVLKIIKKLKIKLGFLDLKLQIGTIDIIITSLIVAFISAIIGIILPHIINNTKSKNYKYKIEPIYNMENSIKMSTNCIIEIKIVHIIYVIYKLLKRKRVDKHERTSNRRTYDYGYEQY